MKNIIRLIIITMIFLNSSCKSIKMVKTTNDMFLLKEKESEFINKPLKKLLKEIEPKIKTGVGNNEAGHFYFYFKFISLEERLKNLGKYDDKVSLFVYVKEPIDWVWDKRPKGNEQIWTKEDAKKYGNLIVTRIKVINQPK
ncbi:hypothetical protein B6A10_16280, partial [Flavobacterium sp. L1I52]